MADRYCGNCGRELASRSGFCPCCGMTTRLTVGPLAREQEPQAFPRRPSEEPGTGAGSRGAGRTLLLSVVACLLLAAAWLVLRFGPGFLERMFGDKGTSVSKTGPRRAPYAVTCSGAFSMGLSVNPIAEVEGEPSG